jgi:diguanylate cyclase (GGDEF)-like protein/PAS domain S-box-containing protein
MGQIDVRGSAHLAIGLANRSTQSVLVLWMGSRMQRVGRIGAALVGVTGLVVLVGWYTGVTSLTTVLPGYGAMKPNTALAFVALAIAVMLLDRGRFALPLGLAVAALGCVTLLESALGRSFGVDVLLPGVGLDRAAGRMAPATATALVLLGAAVVACRLGRALVMRCLAMAALLVAEVAVLGYVYGASSLYTVGGDTRMALITAACVAVLALAILLYDPSAGLVGLIRSQGSAGRLLRAAVPSLLVGPALLGWLGLWAQRDGWFGTTFGVAVLVLSMTVLGLVLIWRVAVTLRQLDRQRDDAARAMAEANEYLEAKIAERTKQLADRQSFTDALLETAEVGIFSCDADGANWVRNRAGRAMLGLQPDAPHGLRPEVAAPLIGVLDAAGHTVAVEDYPLLRALRGEDVGTVELLLGPAGGPYRESISRSSQIVGSDGTVLGAVSAISDISVERAAARALNEEHGKLVEAQRLGQLGSFEYDFKMKTWSFSEQMAVLWGVELDGLDPLGTQMLIVEEDRELASRSWQDASKLGGRHTYEYRIRRADDGAERLLRSTVEIELDSAGRPVRGRGTYLDITDVTAAEKAAQHANTFLNAVLAATPDFTFITELATGAVVYGSDDKNILGISADQLAALGKRAVAALVHPDDQPRLLAMNTAAAALLDGQVLTLRYRAMHADGQWRWLNRRITPFRRDASGNVVEVLGVMRDISDIVEAEDRLTHAALHDALTGLPNRSLLIDRLDAALARSARDGREVAVLFCDLDGFKRVNDTAGHAAGDAVLIETARRLSAVLRPGDTVARVGGDEFVIVVEPWNRTNGADQPDATSHSAEKDRALSIRVAERIGAAVAAPITVHDVEHVVTASIGVTYATMTSGTGSITADQVLEDADAAMYLAKGRGKDRIEIFEHSLRSDPAERRRVEQHTNSSWGERTVGGPARPIR